MNPSASGPTGERTRNPTGRHRRIICAGSLVAALAACSRSGLDVDETAEMDGSSGSDGEVQFNDDPDGASDAPGSLFDSHVTQDGACGPVTCPGCCDATGACVLPGPKESLCGSNGEACEFCPEDAGFLGCKSAACLKVQPNCGPNNCNGCCFTFGGSSYGYCATGNHDTACGNAGAPCARCVPSEGTGQCVSRGDAGPGGTCTKAACSPSTCVGCCIGDVCAVGTQDLACGKGGAGCSNCLFDFMEHCVAQACVKK